MCSYHYFMRVERDQVGKGEGKQMFDSMETIFPFPEGSTEALKQINGPTGLLAQTTCLTSFLLLDFVMDTGVLHPDLTFRTEILLFLVLEVLAAKGPDLSPCP